MMAGIRLSQLLGLYAGKMLILVASESRIIWPGSMVFEMDTTTKTRGAFLGRLHAGDVGCAWQISSPDVH